jgi:hypothetical protein
MIRMPKVTGIVSQNGKGVQDIAVKYSLNGITETVITDAFGRYVIPVSLGSKIEIISADGRSLSDHFSITVQKKLTEVNIRV